jgi:hypothetical protein
METHAIVIADPTCVIRMLKGGRQTASISKRFLFDTHPSFLPFHEQEGYRVVSKPVSLSKFQNLTYAMSFDTILIYATDP